ncbi:MAG: LemA family protein, partial [Planctomycetota bacterium]|nr:LemA family protein [Planctomycetota bacterium]
LRVEQDPQKLPFIISNLPERRLKTMKISAAFWLLAFAVAGVASLILFGTLFSGGVSALDELLAALGAITMMGFCMVIILYNDLVFLRERTRWARSNIEVALKKRHDLLPNLEDVCTEYLAHERAIQASVTSLRAGYARKSPAQEFQKGDPEGISEGLDRLLSIRESYPQLKANTVVDQLFAAILELENEIAAKRSGYNAAVERYRARLLAFPELLIGRLGRFENEALVEMPTKMTDLGELDFTRPPNDAP